MPVVAGLLILVAIAAYLAALAAYTVFVAPFVAGGAALFFAGALVVAYGAAVRGVLVLRTPEFQVVPPYRPEDERQPAYRQYFFGPALRDLRQIVMVAWPRCADRAENFGSWTTRTFFAGREADGLATVPVGITLWIGLIAGCALAGVVLGALAVLQGLAVLTAQVLARAFIAVLRGIDTVILRAKGISGMICPWCYVRCSYPSYECPRCRRLHSDIRPGPYGVVRRRCQCGEEKLPTLLILGTYRLPAMCTNVPVCGRQMSDETGRFAEFVLPFFGGRSAGKTRLMAAMIMGLEETGRYQGASVRLADDETRHSYDVLREVLGIRGNTLGTHGQLPRAHSVLVAVGRFKRLLHIFDAAGERFGEIERTDELRYLRLARTYLFVLDPMSVPEFWSQLAAHERDDLDRALASEMLPETVFNQSVQTMIGMRAKIARSRLAVAVSKTDVIQHTGLLQGRRDDSEWVERWLVDSLGQGNLVRAMRNEFKEVRFFFTAAVMDGEDHVDGSVLPLVTWCLQEERFRSRRARSPVPAGTLNASPR